MCFESNHAARGPGHPPVHARRASRGQFRGHFRDPLGGRELGFSLIEVMVVVVIIGLLAGAVALRVTGYMETARANRAKSDIAVIMDAIEAYHLTHSRYPSNEQGLSVLPLENTRDPWGNPYGYNNPGSRGPYEVFTLGADAREGGEGAEADLYSWEVREGQDGQP